MASMKKLLGFRQLSLNGDASPPRRPSLKKQLSEERGEFKNWPDDLGIRLNLADNARFVKPAWVDPIDTINDEPVIIRKFGENRHSATRKLTRQTSLDNDSSPASQKDRQNLKPNLKIILSQNSLDYTQETIEIQRNEPPKIIKPLITNVHDKNCFKIRKNAKASAEKAAWQVPNKATVPDSPQVSTADCPAQPHDGQADVKPIASVIIRPTTAASKREMFQKRTNSAFTTTVTTLNNKEPQKARRPLIRTSSAPCKPEHVRSKLVFQKHRKSFKKIHLKSTASKTSDAEKNEENSRSNCQAPGAEVVTMVSLISPEGSDGEEQEEDKQSSLEKSGQVQKIGGVGKTSKTVSFQQSSIHAIRSFSASFPARRSSVSAALLMNNSLNSFATKGQQEKRGTNSTKFDDDERMPKRRFVRNSKEDSKTASFDQRNIDDEIQKDEQKQIGDLENPNQGASDDVKTGKEQEASDVDLKSPKEKQCWSMYCKMTEKGINVSFDTILRGMLTPTEYRLSRKHSLIPPNAEPSKST
ncbi:unnamed protein product [Phyllotreta striolata]|uniref:Uncharacterized protein n=1 Tax=Phyllotreta striolata TaxID=444603 RepID=A0A9N9TFE9_PHYSR|nr:unnamed protein product [Phyllotreta striolata]